MKFGKPLLIALFAAAVPGAALAQAPQAAAERFQAMDVFSLEYAADPRISPDGRRVVYERRFMDVMTDRERSNLWLIGADGGGHVPLTTGNRTDRSPRWSPDGTRVAYVSTEEDGAQIWVRWIESGEVARLSRVTESPGGLSWSPDGESLAFTMLVPSPPEEPLAELPKKPEGAEWAPAARVFTQMYYRADGPGYLEPGTRQIFVLPAEGGTPRQITFGDFDAGNPTWSPDGRTILFSATPDREGEPLDSEIFEVQLADGATRSLTDRRGPDRAPVVSPDGRHIAYTGFDDRRLGYQVSRLYVMDRDGSGSRELAAELDRDIGGLVWSADSRSIYFQYDTEGDTRVANVSLDGRVRDLAEDLGGNSLGRPYGGGSFSVADNGRFVYTHTTPARPSDLAVGGRGVDGTRVITRLNDDLFSQRELGEVEDIWYTSSHDGRRVQGWIIKPPNFDESRRYPLILEIHGGPFANYGDRFAAELQLYAAAGYVVLYTNPRGSTSYGGEFGNLIHHDYPNNDYHDLISGVDAVIERGYVDPARLYVTGGSGGGVLSAWIVGNTDRFRAAAVQKPVINWFSWALTADSHNFGVRYWFPMAPWEDPEHYMRRSPISRVGNVSTPTMLITGEEDYRTPMSESEQFYQALQLRGVPTALVRIPEASHGITARPSNLIAKVAYVLGWFERYGGGGAGAPGSGN